MSRRTEKVAALVQKELGELMLAFELPTLTTISKVEVSDDLRHAKVWITIFDKNREHEEEVLKILKDNLYELQGELNRKFTMKIVPRINFTVDQSQHYVAHISELLREVGDEEN